MKKIKFIVLALVLAALVLIVLSYKKEDYNIYKNESWSFQISYPTDWIQQLINEAEEGVIIGFFSPQEDSEDTFSENVSVTATIKDPSKDFEMLVEEGLENLEQEENRSAIENSKVKLAGLSGYKIFYTETSDESELQFLHYWLEGKNEKVYIVIYSAEISKYSEYWKKAKKIIDSFKIL